MGIAGAIVCLSFFCLVLSDFWQRLPAGQGPKFRRWFLFWAIKGLLVPILLWVLFDGGIFDCFPPFTPEVEYAKLAGHGFAGLCDAVTIGLFVIGSYWAALTSAWLLASLVPQTENREEFNHCVLLWSAFLAPVAALITRNFGWQFAGVGGTLWFLPIVQRVLSPQPEQKVRPVYSRAIAKLHFDKHEEAEAAVLEELEKCEDDFDGWLLLAELYAKHCVELLKKNPDDIALREEFARLLAEQLDAVDPGLEQLELLLAMPNPPEKKAAQWLSLMAVWQLKYKQDQPSARKLLERVVRLYPNTPQAFAAQTRLSLMDAETRMCSRSKI